MSEVAEQDWQTLYRKVGEHRVDTGQQWADVNFVLQLDRALQEQP